MAEALAALAVVAMLVVALVLALAHLQGAEVLALLVVLCCAAAGVVFLAQGRPDATAEMFPVAVLAALVRLLRLCVLARRSAG